MTDRAAFCPWAERGAVSFVGMRRGKRRKQDLFDEIERCAIAHPRHR